MNSLLEYNFDESFDDSIDFDTFSLSDFSVFQSDESLSNSDSNDYNLNPVGSLKPKSRKRSEVSRIKKNKLRRIGPHPRVLKRDPRRLYFEMFANVVNSGNSILIGEFVNRYFSPHISFSKYEIHNTETGHNIKLPVFLDRKGLEAVKEYFSSCTESFPDFVSRYNSSQVIPDDDDKKSKIVGGIVISGTLIPSMFDPSHFDPSVNNAFLCDKSLGMLQSYKKPYKFYKFSIYGVMQLYLDENHYIIGLEMLSKGLELIEMKI